MVPTTETTTTKKPDFNKANIKKAIAQGKEMIKSGMSKADVSRDFYQIRDMDQLLLILVLYFMKMQGLIVKISGRKSLKCIFQLQSIL